MKPKYHQYVLTTSNMIEGVREDLDRLDQKNEILSGALDIKRADQLKDAVNQLVVTLEHARRIMAQIRDRHT